MKNLTMRLMFAAAALAAVAVTASAQTYKAEVPMAFRAGDKLMEAGTYNFTLFMNGAGQPLIIVRNAADHSASLLPTFRGDTPSRLLKLENPIVSFQCSGRTCSLAKLWDGRSETYELPVKKLPATETAQTSVITLALSKAD